MKSGSYASYRAAGALGDDRDDEEPIADAQLVRQWWYVYLWCLKGSYDVAANLNPLTAECEVRGIVKPGLPMTRAGAEDLAKQVDELQRSFAP